MPTQQNIYRVTIQAPPETIFNYISDLTRHSEWSGGPLKVEALSSGPVAAGSQYISHGDLPGQKNRRNELRVVKLQSPSLFEFVAKDPGFGEVVHTFTIKPQAEGRTLVERTVTTTLPPFMALMSRLFLHPMIGKPMMNKSLASLKARLEKRPAT